MEKKTVMKMAQQNEIELPSMNIPLFDIMLVLKRLAAGTGYKVAKEYDGDKHDYSTRTTQASIGPVIFPYPIAGGRKLLIGPEKLEKSGVDLEEARLLMHRLKQELAAYDGKPSVQYREHCQKRGLCVMLIGGIISLFVGALSSMYDFLSYGSISIHLQENILVSIPGLVVAIVGFLGFIKALAPGTDHGDPAT